MGFDWVSEVLGVKGMEKTASGSGKGIRYT